MKYRIILKSRDGYSTDNFYYVAQKRPVYSPFWKNIEYFYKSDFEDMPGWFTHICSDKNKAMMLINDDKQQNGDSITTVIYEE